MGIFQKLTEKACALAIITLENYKKGNADAVVAFNALKTLAGGGKLFLKEREHKEELKSYYWVKNNQLVNIQGRSYDIRTVSSNEINSFDGWRFVKVYAPDCEYIRISPY